MSKHDLNTLASMGPAEVAGMGLNSPFDAHQPGHLTALREATRLRLERRAKNDYNNQNNNENERATARQGQ